MAPPFDSFPRYKSHKEVRAATICAVGDAAQDGSRYIYFTDEQLPPVLCEAPMFARYVPVPNDYLVVYRDNYKSFSPKKEFDDGYALLEPDALEMI